MYDYFKDKEYLKRARNTCSKIMIAVQEEARRQGINCQFFLIGSGAKNLITYQVRRDNKVYIDFDYNLHIISCNDWEDKRTIKETVRKAFNKVWKKEYGKEGIQDSKSSLTTNLIYFNDYPNIFFSIDLGIIVRDKNNKTYRLIHDKIFDGYSWDSVPDSSDVSRKAKELKAYYLWDCKDGVRDVYLRLKNMYLSRNDDNHPSFVCYIEAVNQVYNANKKYMS